VSILTQQAKTNCLNWAHDYNWNARLKNVLKNGGGKKRLLPNPFFKFKMGWSRRRCGIKTRIQANIVTEEDIK